MAAGARQRADTERTTRALCAAASSARDEPLSATASRIDHWIVLEYRGRWGREVLGSSLLSDHLKESLRAQLAGLRHARLLFVKQPERRPHLVVHLGTLHRSPFPGARARPGGGACRFG